MKAYASWMEDRKTDAENTPHYLHTKRTLLAFSPVLFFAVESHLRMVKASHLAFVKLPAAQAQVTRRKKVSVGQEGVTAKTQGIDGA